MKVVLSVVLVAIAAASGLVGFGALSNLVAEYQDSPTSTYLLIGLPLAALSVAAIVAVVGLWRR